MKTVRFTEVVERSGRPQVHAFWSTPERDAEFQRARKAGRVMTLEPSKRGKADVGHVGFAGSERAPGQVLIFPRSLKPFAGARVVGIKFDLVEQPRSVPAHDEIARATRRSPRRKQHPTSAETISTPAPEPTATQAKWRPHATRVHSDEHAAEPSTHRKIDRRPPAAARKRHGRAAAKVTTKAGGDSRLVREVRAALDELRAGKTVAAYHRLEHALPAS